VSNNVNGPKVTVVAPHAGNSVSEAGYMLEHLVDPALLDGQKPVSDNATGADNQQERPWTAGWITGFIDGEGTFSVSIYRNRATSAGWQVRPEFVVTQGERSVSVLRELQAFFGCGEVYINRRHDNHREHVYRYCVRRLADLKTTIIPFFQANQLRTAKRTDFERFAEVVRMMDRREHLTPSGMRRVAEVAQSMNRRKPSVFLESSETIRQPSREG
jgi:LAGLIDADG endonuclease